MKGKREITVHVAVNVKLRVDEAQSNAEAAATVSTNLQSYLSRYPHGYDMKVMSVTVNGDKGQPIPKAMNEKIAAHYVAFDQTVDMLAGNPELVVKFCATFNLAHKTEYTPAQVMSKLITMRKTGKLAAIRK